MAGKGKMQGGNYKTQGKKFKGISQQHKTNNKKLFKIIRKQEVFKSH